MRIGLGLGVGFTRRGGGGSGGYIPTLTLFITPSSPADGQTVTITGSVDGFPLPTDFLAISVEIEGIPVTLSGDGLTRTFTATTGTLEIIASVSNVFGIANDTLTTEIAAFSLGADDWFAQEAADDADTRKTFAQASASGLPGGKELAIYSGSNSAGDLGALSEMTNAGGGIWTWESTAQADIGATVYVRIAMRNTDNSGAEWVSSAKSFVASNVPVAPSWTWEPGVDDVTVTLGATDGRGRTVTSGEYRIDGGSWVAMPNLVSFVVELGGTASHTLGLRLANVNGNSAEAVETVAATGGTPVEELTIYTPDATPRVGDSLGYEAPSGVIIGAIYLQTARPDRYGAEGFEPEVEWCTREVRGPINTYPLDTKSLGMYIRAIAAVHDGSGDFVEFITSNVLGPVQYATGFLTGATLIDLNDWATLNTARANNAITKIALAGGVWDTASNVSALQNRNRSVSPLTICAQDPANRPVGGRWDLQGSNSITLLAMDVNGPATSGTPCYSIADTTNITLDGCWGINGPRWTKSQIDTTPIGANGDTIWGWFLKPSNSNGLTVRNSFSEFCTVFMTFSATNDTMLFEGLFHRGWWQDFILVSGQYSPTSNAIPTDNITIRDVLCQDLVGVGEEMAGANRMPHPDYVQFTNYTVGSIKFHQFVMVSGDNRSYTLRNEEGAAPAPQGFFSSGSGAFDVEVCSYAVNYNLGNAFNIGPHRKVRVEDVTETKTDPTGTDGALIISWPDTARWLDGFGTELRTVDGFMAPLTFAQDGGYDADIHEPVKFDLAGGVGNYSWKVSGPLPFRTMGTASYVSKNVHEFLQYHRPISGYEGYGAVTPEGYIKPVRSRPVAPVVTATRDGADVDVSWGAVTGADEYIIRWRRLNAQRFWESTYTRQVGTTLTMPGVSNAGLEVQVFAVVNGTASAPGIDTVAGVDFIPTLDIEQIATITDTDNTIGGAVYYLYRWNLNALGWPDATITITDGAFNGVSRTVTANGGNLSATTVIRQVQYYDQVCMWVPRDTNGIIEINGTASNSEGSTPFAIEYAHVGAAPETVVDMSVAPTATNSQLEITVTTTDYDDFDADLCVRVDSGTVYVLATPPAAGTYLIDADEGVIAGTPQTVHVFVSNNAGNGPLTSEVATSAGGSATLVYYDKFTSPRTPQSDMTASQTLQTVTPITGTAWTRLTGTSGINLLMDAGLVGVRCGGSSGTQNACYSMGVLSAGDGNYAEGVFNHYTLTSNLNARIGVMVAAAGVAGIWLEITNTQLRLVHRNAAGTDTTIGTAYTFGYAANTAHTVRVEVRSNSQTVLLDGAPVISGAVATSGLADLGTYTGLRNAIASGINQTGPKGVLWQEVEFGTL